MATTDKSDVSSSLSKLTIDSSKEPSSMKTKPKSKKVVADSWEDEDVSDEEVEVEEPEQEQISKSPAPSASPKSHEVSHEWIPTTSLDPVTSSSGNALPEKRPEKTDAVARRMIAAGLGLKAPRQTEEQREYQKSIREKEKKRREQEKSEEARQRELTEKAKAAIWDD